MEGYFSGTVIILYFLSRYAAEYIFVAACFLPTLCCAATMLFLRFGGAGGMISAWRRSKPYRRAGVVSRRERERFYAKCVKGTSPSFRASYALFLEGKLSSAELTDVGVRSVSSRKRAFPFCVTGVGVLSAILVFLTFYFLVPIGETMLRTAICAFHGAVGAVSHRFLSLDYVARAEKAALRFCSSLDALILRNPSPDPSLPRTSETTMSFSPKSVSTPRALRTEEDFSPPRRTEPRQEVGEDADLVDLRRLLHEMDSAAKTS